MMREQDSGGGGSRQKPGPKPDTLRIEGDAAEAIRRFLRVQRPPEGWPEEVKRTRKPKK